MSDAIRQVFIEKHRHEFMWIEDNIEKTLLFDFSVMSDGIRQIFIKNIKTWI